MTSNILKIRTGHVCAQEASLSEKGRQIQEIFQELNSIFQELSIPSFLVSWWSPALICRWNRASRLMIGAQVGGYVPCRASSN